MWERIRIYLTITLVPVQKNMYIKCTFCTIKTCCTAILEFCHIPWPADDSFKTRVMEKNCPLYYSWGETRLFHFTTVCSGVLQAIFCQPLGRKPRWDSASSLVPNLLSAQHLRNSNHTANVLTKSLKQSPSWAAKRRPDGQEFSSFLLNHDIHYSVHKTPPTVSNLSHKNPIPANTVFPWTNLILCFHLRLGLPLLSGFLTKMLYSFLISTMHASCYVHLIVNDYRKLLLRKTEWVKTNLRNFHIVMLSA